jgi:hypothetical protein
MSIDKIFRINVRRLNLREQPGTDSRVLVGLDAGQAVARLDEVDRAGWWYVFVDTPGEGIFLGHVYAQFLRPAFSDAAAGQAVLGPVVQVPPGEGDAPAMETDDDSTPERDAGGMGTILDGDGTEPPTPTPPAQWTDGWNPAIPAELRYKSDNQSPRRGNGRIDRVIIHITGPGPLEKIVERFTVKGNFASAHYLVMPNGQIHQFVPETLRAWHAGINKHVGALYKRGDGSWRNYKRYFDWHKGYPPDAIYLDANGHMVPPSQREKSAVLVTPGHRGEWPDYGYFDRRWGRLPVPVGYTPGFDPNNNSIGIEVFSVGKQTLDPRQYTDEMYSALGALVGNICQRHRLPISREAVCGHEDVNPVERWGWDPNQGFDWDKLFTLARQSAASVA